MVEGRPIPPWPPGIICASAAFDVIAAMISIAARRLREFDWSRRTQRGIPEPFDTDFMAVILCFCRFERWLFFARSALAFLTRRIGVDIADAQVGGRNAYLDQEGEQCRCQRRHRHDEHTRDEDRQVPAQERIHEQHHHH